MLAARAQAQAQKNHAWMYEFCIHFGNNLVGDQNRISEGEIWVPFHEINLQEIRKVTNILRDAFTSLVASSSALSSVVLNVHFNQQVKSTNSEHQLRGSSWELGG